MSYPLKPGARSPAQRTVQRGISLADLSKHPDLQAQYNREMKAAGCCNKDAVSKKFLARLRERG